MATMKKYIKDTIDAGINQLFAPPVSAVFYSS